MSDVPVKGGGLETHRELFVNSAVVLPQAWGLPEAGERPGRDPFLSHQRDPGPAHILTLDFWPQNCETMNFCDSKLPNL